ncbi:MAG TPA: hypothetical protein VKU19_13245 [Bryobacteraceae bacterium]|nr:hypothetical protein [Bryobacteraceae bacterium]
MKFTLFAVLLLAAGALSANAAEVVIGGYYPGHYGAPPRVPVVAYRPPSPGPGYAWINGYWVPSGARYTWAPGYWARPPYARAYWVAPRYYGGRYYRGYWRR